MGFSASFLLSDVMVLELFDKNGERNTLLNRSVRVD